MLAPWALVVGCPGELPPPVVAVPEPPPLVAHERLWHGGEAWDEAGTSVEAGDVDGDGISELFVGAPASAFTYSPDDGRMQGVAYVLPVVAPSGGFDPIAAARFLGYRPGDFGSRVALPGDLTGDGIADFIVNGEASEDPHSWTVVFRGPATGDADVDDAYTRVVYDPDREFACCAARCGDLDGDSQPELCVGWGLSPGDSGPFLYRGPLAKQRNLHADDADVRLVAPGLEWAGQRLDSADLTGDGVPELLVGAENRNEDAGGVYVVSDPPDGTHELADYPLLTGDAGSDAGHQLATGGDLDGDGTEDFYVSGHIYDTRTGRGWVVTEPAAGPLSGAHTVLAGTAEFEWFGIDAAFGDFDGDGATDLAVGIPGDFYFSFDAPGRVAVHQGPLPTGTITERDALSVFRGSDAPDGFGAQLTAADGDGDGDDDLIVGAPKDSVFGTLAGAVYLLTEVTP